MCMYMCICIIYIFYICYIQLYIDFVFSKLNDSLYKAFRQNRKLIYTTGILVLDNSVENFVPELSDSG